MSTNAINGHNTGCLCIQCTAYKNNQLANQQQSSVSTSITTSSGTVTTVGAANCSSHTHSIATSSYQFPCTCSSSGGTMGCIQHNPQGWLHSAGQMMTGQWIGGGSLFQAPTISPEETKELEELDRQYKEDVKNVKLQAFRELPSALRQHVINQLVWYKMAQEISHKTATKSQRHIDLEGKKLPFQMAGLSTYIGSVQSTMWGNIPNTSVPPVMIEGLSADDLIQAHNDATLEESISDDQD